MNKKLLLFVLAFEVFLCSAQNQIQAIDSIMQTYYKDAEPGAAIAIKLKGKLIFKKSYGRADLVAGEPITSASNFNIGSLTKQFTAYAILILLKQNRIKLTDPLTTYFPHFTGTVGRQVTILELLTHSSGIVDHYSFVDTAGLKHATDKDVLAAIEQIDSLYFKPGTRFRYSNTAYCLLGMIIEKVSGMPYAQYIRKNIFEPLGMKHSMVWQIGKKPGMRVKGYERSKENRFRQLDDAESIFFSTEADGGIFTSLDDYLKYWDAIQSNMLLDSALISRTRSPQFPVDPARGLYYGFGWFLQKTPDGTNVYHTGSNGGFRAVVFSIPAKNDLIVLFSNRSDIELENIIIEINKILSFNDKYYIKIDSLESFNNSCPNFAPCKKTVSYSILSTRNWSAKDMALN